MKQIFTIIIISVFSLSSSAQTIDILSTISANLNQNSCSPMSFTVSILQGCANFTYLGNSSSVSNDTIYLNIDYSGSFICFGALSYPTYTVSVPSSPANTYVVYAKSYVNGVISDIHVGFPLTVTNIGCCPAIAQIGLNQDPVCFGDTLEMQSTGGGATSQNWYVNGSLFSIDTIAYQPANSPTPYNLELIVTDGTCSDTATQTINVQMPPSINLGNDTSICDGSALIKTVSNTYSQYIWSDSSITNSGAISSAGSLSVTVQDAFGCEGSDTMSILSLIDLTNVSLSMDSVSFCPGDSVAVTVSSNTPGAGFLWSTGAQTPSIFISSGGNYTVTASANDLCANVDTVVSEIFEITPIDFSLDSNLCPPRAVEANNDYVSYSWDNGANSFGTSASVDETLTLTVIDVNGCTTTSSVFVDVNDNPVVDLGNDTTICANGGSVLLSSNTGNGLTLLWNTGDTTASITANGAGSYSIQVTDAFGCTGFDTIVVSEVQCLGISELGEKRSFSVFPNPAKSEIFIRSELTNDFELIDVIGNVVRRIFVTERSTNMNIENLPSGIYILRNNLNQSTRIIKQ